MITEDPDELGYYVVPDPPERSMVYRCWLRLFRRYTGRK